LQNRESAALEAALFDLLAGSALVQGASTRHMNPESHTGRAAWQNKRRDAGKCGGFNAKDW
jgi:hypothetical protein